jgi:prephenate dehydrogenase
MPGAGILSRPLFTRVYLLGAGLIGGSLALDARARGLAGRVEGWDEDPEALSRALELGLLDAAVPFVPSRLASFDLVVLATPVLAISRALAGGGFATGSLVTDVGSVKASLVEAFDGARRRGEGWDYVPGHPIAGDERSGPGAARSGLFDGARCVLTPAAGVAGARVDEVAALWQGLGCRVTRMDPAEHDQVFAHVSHLPHMAAFALMEALAGERSDWLSWSGAGLRDATRIAASSPRMWAEIAVANRDQLLRALGRHREGLDGIARLIESGDRAGLEAFFNVAAMARRRMQ